MPVYLPFTDSSENAPGPRPQRQIMRWYTRSNKSGGRVNIKPAALLLLLLCLGWANPVSADNPTPSPLPLPTSQPIIVAPTEPPVYVEPTVPAVAEPTVASEAPPAVSKETHPIQSSGSAPVESEPTIAATIPPPQSTEPPVLTPTPLPPAPVSPTIPPSVSQNDASPQATATTSAGTSPGITLPPTVTSGSTPNQSNPIYDVSSTSASAAAPSQLQCTAKKWPMASPFLSAPYAGWADINSFVDHDSPDYSVDGTIVIANGVTATASQGQESDFFPAYWSSDLRQYVNYDGHNGYDFGVSYQPILAAAGGTIMYAGWNSPDPYAGYGQMILIDHHNGYVTLYGHLSKLEVQTGDSVSAGQEIAISGTTGRSSGPHLHFSVFHNCQVTDPYGWTGGGRDVLQDFNGQQSRYLWIPNHDPLVLNPPPHWPAFPVGLHVSASVQRVWRSAGIKVTPPAERIVLLQLPLPPAGRSLLPGEALARTRARILAEEELLTPYLDDLEAARQVDAYRILPQAGAIWVRGIAPASLLESLPGVASLSGVSPLDLHNAEIGLSHAVLVQTNAQPAPSLWPVGFRSALHAWRPVLDVVSGTAYVSGVTLPGKDVRLALVRKHKVLATVDTTADPETGGFAGVLVSSNDTEVAAQPGDSVRLSSLGKSVTIDVAPVRVRMRLKSVSGTGVQGSSVRITALQSGGDVLWSRLVQPRSGGTYRIAVLDPSEAGYQAVVTSVDIAGDEQSALGVAPGLSVKLGSDLIRGWTVGAHPVLTLKRGRRVLLQTPVHAAAGGSFVIHARRFGVPLVLAPGDTIQLASPGSKGHSITLPSIAPGISRVSARGDRIAAGTPATALDVELTRALISGKTQKSMPVRIAIQRSEKQIAEGFGISDATGRFRVAAVDASGSTPTLRPGDVIAVETLSTAVPVSVQSGILLRRVAHGFRVTFPAHQPFVLTVTRRHDTPVSTAFAALDVARDITTTPTPHAAQSAAYLRWQVGTIRFEESIAARHSRAGTKTAS
jgi:murein DD-endopeptidase MepM/ murein hydrolase activator NlpD